MEALRFAANAKGVSVAQIAIAWVRAKGDDNVLLVGWRRLSQLDEALGSLALTMTSADLRAIEESIAKGAAVGERYAPARMAMPDSERGEG